MKYRLHSLCLFAFLWQTQLSASRSITGYVLDGVDKEPLVEALVKIEGSEKSITTDFDGFFELIIPEEKVKIKISLGEYEDEIITIDKGNKNIKKDIFLKPIEIISTPSETFIRPKTKAAKPVVAEDDGKTRIVSGFVSNKREGLIGANISVEGTDIGTVTEYDGSYALSIPTKKVVLKVDYTGYDSKSIVIEKGTKNLDADFILDEGMLLESVVITGMSTKRSKKEKRTKSKKRDKAAAEIAAESVADYSAYPATTTTSTIPGTTRVEEKPVPVASPPPTPPAEAYADVREEMEKEEVVMLADDYDSDGIVGGGESREDLPEAGQLTAGVLNDFGKWNLWQDIAEVELKKWQMEWGVSPMERYTIQLTTQNGYPIVDAEVNLRKDKKILWTSRTDNTGKAELWANIYSDLTSGTYNMEVKYQNNKYEIPSITDFHEGINTKVIPVVCNIPNKVDIAFVVDATGSMGDEINYLKSELYDVIGRVKSDLKDTELRLGSVFYRDHGDAYLTRKSHFSPDINKTIEFIKRQKSGGGGDAPEAVEEALDVALDGMVWSENAAARLLFLVLDAPPHQTDEIKKRLEKQIRRAAEMGIRVIPVACSGTDRSTEYLMRSFCLATNGSYIYLTDDSGIGASHLKPITDEHKVNLLNDILVNTILDFTQTVSCDEQLEESLVEEEVSDTTEVEMIVQVEDESDPDKLIDKKEFSWKYFPNPTRGNLNVELSGELTEMYLLDAAGKLLRKIDVTDPIFTLNLYDFPSGLYYLRGIGEEEREVSGKVILIRMN